MYIAVFRFHRILSYLRNLCDTNMIIIIIDQTGCGLVDAIEPVETLVVDGEFAENKFPWTVLVYTKIGRNLISYGTGALITPLHVLTAAHLLLT